MIETYGFDALDKTFYNFQHKDKRNIIISAFRKAVRPTVEQAKSNLSSHTKTGNLMKSIGVVPIRDEIAVYVGARIKGQFKGYHGHLVEEGTVARFYITKKGNRHETGKMRYTGFFRSAVKTTEEQVMKTVEQEWYNSIDRFIVKSNRRDS